MACERIVRQYWKSTSTTGLDSEGGKVEGEGDRFRDIRTRKGRRCGRPVRVLIEGVYSGLEETYISDKRIQ